MNFRDLDRDLRIVSGLASLVFVVNVVSSIVLLLNRQWTNAAITLAWAGCCLLWRLDIRTQQTTRDLSRRNMRDAGKLFDILKAQFEEKIGNQ